MIRAALLALLLTGCATPQPAVSPLVQCVEMVAGQTIYTTDRIAAAEWCAKNLGNLK